jgi:hypothetical protein
MALVVLVFIYTINSVDRYVVSSAKGLMKGNWNFSGTERFSPR